MTRAGAAWIYVQVMTGNYVSVTVQKPMDGIVTTVLGNSASLYKNRISFHFSPYVRKIRWCPLKRFL
eukprot:scaffold7337_cov131-Cylindrotheca_fusiformis.AAC.3